MSSNENETAILSLSSLNKKTGDFCTKHSFWVHPILLYRYYTSLENGRTQYTRLEKCAEMSNCKRQIYFGVEIVFREPNFYYLYCLRSAFGSI